MSFSRINIFVEIQKLRLRQETDRITSTPDEDDQSSDEEDEQPRPPLKSRKGSRAAPIDLADDDEDNSSEPSVKVPSVSESSLPQATTVSLEKDVEDLTDNTPAPLERFSSSTNSTGENNIARTSAPPAEKDANENGMHMPLGSSATTDENEQLDTIPKTAAASNTAVAVSASAQKDQPFITGSANTEKQVPSADMEDNLSPGGTDDKAPATITTDTAVVKKRVSTRKRKADEIADGEPGVVVGAIAAGVATRSQ